MTSSEPLASASSEREILPQHLKAIHYDLTVEPHLEEATEFDGTVAIDLEVVEETSSITLNAIDLEISKTEVITEDGIPIETFELEFDKVRERVIIGLKQKVTAGQKIKLEQTFKGSLLHNAAAFFRSPVVKDGKTKWMASTQLEATDARRVFPCFDEPASKATFTVTLIADKDLTCLSNMDVESEQDVGKGKKKVTFNKTPPMSTYILAFAVGDFNFIETNNFRVPVRVYATADNNIEHGRFNLEHTARILKTFERIFDIEYPLPKLDMIAVPSHEGAMENWGLIIFGDSFLLVDEKESSAEAFRQSGSTVVHEVAHQWFGNLVTMEFWDGLWLNESFADWAELYAWETLDPSWQMWLQYAVGGYQEGLVSYSNKASHPIEVPVNKATEINQIFDDISYNKGCGVIRMISRHLGVEIFIKGVQNYLKEAAYGNALTSDLWAALSEVSGKDVAKMMGTWTKHIGYPVIHVTENESAETITVTQHRYLQDGSQNPEDDTVLYPLKLRIRTKHGVDDEIELVERSKTVKVSPAHFFKLNADHFGFYRVLYSPKRLEILAQNLKDNFLPHEDKIGLISDALAMAGSGHSKTSSVLTLLESFVEETNFFVWKEALRNLRIIIQTWDFEDQSVKDGLKGFRTRLVSKFLHKQGWHFKDSDHKVEQMSKALLFGNGGDDPKVKEAAKEMFQAFLAGDTKAINVNIQESVFAIALENGGVKEYNAIQQSLKTMSSIDSRNISVGSLGFNSRPELMSRTLSYSLSPEILAINETDRVLESLSKHAAGKEALWEWFKNNYDEINQKIGGGIGRFARAVKLCTENLNTREQCEDVKKFFDGKDTEEYNVYLAQSIGMIEAKVSWVDRDREDVKQWLEKRGYSKTS
ncbi:Aminopeptidase 2 [Hyphodiscus hymeniophilus]|uniref:Aminopeptidase n=1 Tax=Hyphodiscus hymeniophilus TaxID=353542 RepID=A0A9P7AZI0_9HELO|nr:Aminopeptidase 2 [Hyphodiscus hymeniophilus]